MDKFIKYLNKISQDIRNKPLNTLESDAFKMLFDGHTYLDVSAKLGYDSNYIGDIARVTLTRCFCPINP